MSCTLRHNVSICFTILKVYRLHQITALIYSIFSLDATCVNLQQKPCLNICFFDILFFVVKNNNIVPKTKAYEIFLNIMTLYKTNN